MRDAQRTTRLKGLGCCSFSGHGTRDVQIAFAHLMLVECRTPPSPIPIQDAVSFVARRRSVAAVLYLQGRPCTRTPTLYSAISEQCPLPSLSQRLRRLRRLTLHRRIPRRPRRESRIQMRTRELQNLSPNRAMFSRGQYQTQSSR
jgi:hypothetical protein